MTAAPACPPPSSPAPLAARLESVVGHLRKLVADSGLPPDQREDALQEVHLALVQADARFDPARGKWTTFVGAVAKNVLRRLASNYHSSDAEPLRASYRPDGDHRDGWQSLPSGDAEPLDILIAKEEAELNGEAEALAEAAARAVRAAGFKDRLAVLTPGLRKLVEYVVLDGLSPVQIAERTGQPTKSVKANLQAAIAMLLGHTPAEAKAAREQRCRELLAADPAVTDAALADAIGISVAGAAKLRREIALASAAGRHPPRKPTARRAVAVAVAAG